MLFNSKIKKLPSLNVLAIACRNSNPKMPLNEALARVKLEFSLPNTWQLQEGNSIFIVHKSSIPGFGYFAMYNADTIRNVIQNVRTFFAAAYKVGFDNLVAQIEDPAVLQTLKYVFKGMDTSKTGYVVQRTNRGSYQVTITLGPARSAK